VNTNAVKAERYVTRRIISRIVSYPRPASAKAECYCRIVAAERT
jgi:hypothetical protein